jgi:pyruvate, water dikinase
MALYIKKFSETGIKDLAEVGGKNSSLGEMYNQLTTHGIRIPNGFATTATAFWYFLNSNQLKAPLEDLMSKLDRQGFSNLAETGKKARTLILDATIPSDLAKQIIDAYHALSSEKEIAVAVRSSATAEDLPQASFAGQHESYLNVTGEKALLEAVRKCFASLYTGRAIKYREDNGFDHGKIALSVGIQKMVRSDRACSGVAFTLEPETGFRNVVHIAGAWGLGENIVQGTVTPDEYLVFKPTLKANKQAILQKKLGDKAKMMIYSSGNATTSTINMDTPPELRSQFVLTDEEINLVARWAVKIEEHYSKPMDIEWAKDGLTNELFILQARPETVRSRENPLSVKEYKLEGKGKTLASGNAVGAKIATGIARVLKSPQEADKLNAGDIVVTELTTPDWDPILKKAGGIITDKGGRTSHASIVARELGVPAVIGTNDGTLNIKDGTLITIDCAEGKTGYVYEEEVKFKEIILDFSTIRLSEDTKAMMIMSDPDKAFKLSFYPNHGVGLVRIEFTITHEVQVHPMALIKFDELKDEKLKQKIDRITKGYPDKKQYFIDKLSQGVAVIAAAFYPKDVIVRMSDFKTNEYANLIGGEGFEPHEENPMIGFRGASRYYNPQYKEGFMLECEAMKKVRNDMGLTNVKLMIPFCRTVEEGEKVVAVMHEFGLTRGQNNLEIYVMAEIPSNVLLAGDFARVFDGFSIGSNDLTQLTLGIDRDSAIIADLFSEQNKAAKTMISMMIEGAKKAHTKIGLCGQAPSDYPDFAQFLVEQGIDSISFNPDALLKGIENINKATTRLQMMA